MPFERDQLTVELYEPACMEHRFEDFGEKLTAWVIFLGPESGDTI